METFLRIIMNVAVGIHEAKVKAKAKFLNLSPDNILMGE